MYIYRLIDRYLSDWKAQQEHKPVLLRGARQVGKSTAVRHLGEQFHSFVEINFEKNPEYKTVFDGNKDIRRITAQLAALCGKAIHAGDTLLFFDEIQECPDAIMALRFFREDMPELHVIAAGSLLEFALEELPTFGVGRIHSMFMHPLTFDEFALANGEHLLLQARNAATVNSPLAEPLHRKLTDLLRSFMIVGGMPEVVVRWVETHDYLACQAIQDDILLGYEDDFPKYRKKADPVLLRATLRSAALQATKKFVYTQVGNYKAKEVQDALELLFKAGLLIPVTHTDANGLPLGNEANSAYRKILVMDCGLLLRLLNMSLGNMREMTLEILSAGAEDLVNKGAVAEMLAGLELLYYRSPNLRHELFYWVRMAKNAQAEIDYVLAHNMQVLPIEVKANVQGGMKSLWAFMRSKNLSKAVRCSLENFGKLEYVDTEADNVVREVDIYPLYAIATLYKDSMD